MKIINTDFEGLFIIEPKVFNDHRGYFFESFNKKQLPLELQKFEFVQDNESKSTKGVLRGLHYQLPPHAQSKLVRVIKGTVLDVAVDIRQNSKTFGKHYSIVLSDENKSQLFVPRGFAHGYIVLSTEAIFAYKCDNYYAPDFERCIDYNDPQLKINWRLSDEEISTSEKDKMGLQFSNTDLFHS